MENYNYQEQSEKLMTDPSLILQHWKFGVGMFKIIGPTSHRFSGCLTMIRRQPERFKAVINNEIGEGLSKEIAADVRIPKEKENIRPKHLPVFIEWQTRIDKLQQ